MTTLMCVPAQIGFGMGASHKHKSKANQTSIANEEPWAEAEKEGSQSAPKTQGSFRSESATGASEPTGIQPSVSIGGEGSGTWNSIPPPEPAPTTGEDSAGAERQ